MLKPEMLKQANLWHHWSGSQGVAAFISAR